MCVTVPERVVEVVGTEAVVEGGGSRRRVSLALLAIAGRHVGPGDWILVNSGLAIERVPARRARAVLRMLDEARGVER